MVTLFRCTNAGSTYDLTLVRWYEKIKGDDVTYSKTEQFDVLSLRDVALKLAHIIPKPGTEEVLLNFFVHFEAPDFPF